MAAHVILIQVQSLNLRQDPYLFHLFHCCRSHNTTSFTVSWFSVRLMDEMVHHTVERLVQDRSISIFTSSLIWSRILFTASPLNHYLLNILLMHYYLARDPSMQSPSCGLTSSPCSIKHNSHSIAISISSFSPSRWVNKIHSHSKSSIHHQSTKSIYFKELRSVGRNVDR